MLARLSRELACPPASDSCHFVGCQHPGLELDSPSSYFSQLPQSPCSHNHCLPKTLQEAGDLEVLEWGDNGLVLPEAAHSQDNLLWEHSAAVVVADSDTGHTLDTANMADPEELMPCLPVDWGD